MERPTYTRDELNSYLPSGWNLVDHKDPDWDEKKGVLTLWVLDNVDFDWPVRIKAADAEKEGRLSALETAMDDVFRSRLGRHTRGLGLAG